ncbi:MAG TPA: NAD(+) synthase [Clostridia bacterium]|nr:NAD(+) synthase [Clostridia bacterium]
MFNAEKVCKDIVKWTKDWFNINGHGCNAVIGISGGKDSTVVAALCVKALGADRVIGVLMPNGLQEDINVSEAVCDFLGIISYTINIKNTFNSAMDELKAALPNISQQTIINIQPRLRMSVLYAVSQSLNGRVASTSNLSEEFVGYTTRYGDLAGDFATISSLTASEVKEIGKVLGLPLEFIEKVPIDGLSDKTDEESLGFSYDVLDKFIRTGICEDEEIKEKILRLNKLNEFKLKLVESFQYEQ